MTRARILLVRVAVVVVLLAGVAVRAPEEVGTQVPAPVEADVLAYGAPDLGSTATFSAVQAHVVGIAASPHGSGYWEVAADGAVYAFGAADYAGDVVGLPLARPIVGMAADPDGAGYWLTASDGGVFAFDAPFRGSAGALQLAAPVVAITGRPGGGYWLAARDGGVFAFGAPFLGSAVGLPVTSPVVAIASTATGLGYWLAYADGSVVGFGDAHGVLTHGQLPLAAPVAGMAADPDGSGYWLAAADGGVFTEDAAFRGAATGVLLQDRPVVGIAADPDSGGYWLVRRGTPSGAPPCLDDVVPAAAVRPGMAVRALATSSGTSPAPLTGSVVGTIHDGISAGVDLIVVELDSPALRAAGGIWFGMSGSPVYADDGRLLGAVAYVMSWGPSRYAGLTPAEAMVTGLGDRPATAVALPATAAFKEARRLGALVPLAHPVVVSAPTDAARARVVEALAPDLPAPLVQRGAAPLGAATAADLRAGSPIAMAMSVGDSTVAAIGTVTLVCGGSALAFGHPWTALGRVSASANAVSVEYVQPDEVGGAYTIANVGGVVGAVDADRTVGLRVRLGQAPIGATAITSSVVDRSTGRARIGATTAYDLASSLPWAAYEHLYANLLSVGMDDGGGTVTLHWTLEATAGARSFTFARSNRFTSTAWVNDAAAWEMVQLLDSLVSSNPFVEVQATSIDMVASIGDDVAMDRVVGVDVDRGQGFEPALGTLTVDPGQEIDLRVRLLPYRGETEHTQLVRVTIPPEAAGLAGGIDITGGSAVWIDPSSAASFDDLLALLAAQPRNDDLVATTWIGDLEPVVVSATHDGVVRGEAYVSVEVSGGWMAP